MSGNKERQWNESIGNEVDGLSAIHNDDDDDDDSDEDIDFCPEAEELDLDDEDASGNSEHDVDEVSDDEASDESNKYDKIKDSSTLPTKRISCRRSERRENRRGSCSKEEKLSTAEENSAHTNNLWTDFLKDVRPTAVPSQTKLNVDTTESLNYGTTAADVEKTSRRDKIMATTSAAVSGSKRSSNGAITKERVGSATRGAPGNNCLRSEGNYGGGSTGGLNSLLTQLGKKRKLSVLEKTKLDWSSFKKDEGIDEQIQTFNKGRNGFLERQDFLERTDIRQFQIERNLRTHRKGPH